MDLYGQMDPTDPMAQQQLRAPQAPLTPQQQWASHLQQMGTPPALQQQPQDAMKRYMGMHQLRGAFQQAQQATPGLQATEWLQGMQGQIKPRMWQHQDRLLQRLQKLPHIGKHEGFKKHQLGGGDVTAWV